MAGDADSQVYELRVHGVSGTPPESMLADPFPEQVAGDDVARFFRKTEPIVVGGKSRIVEAFHWGRFTSGSATRTMWLLLSTDDKAHEPRAIGKIETSWRLARTKYRYHRVLGTICLLGGGLVVAAGVYVWLRWLRLVPDDMDREPAAGLGGWVLSGLATALVVIGIRSWQGQKMRTVVGVVWDLIAFWPRYAHPICPPPYGGRATLMLYKRAKDLVREDGKNNTVVLSGHSQGSVVCAAAALLLDHDQHAPNRQLRLITYGSQLQWAFARLFPRYLGHDELKCVHSRLRGLWWNVHRWTDPLGGHVLVWPDSATTNHPLSAPDSHGFGAPRYRPITRTRWYERLGDEYRLRDPESVASRDDRPRSPLRGHSGYYLDPSFDALVTELAATGRAVKPTPPDDLNPAERELIQRARRGAVLEFPEEARPSIRASVIRDLLLCEVHADGVQLKHANIVGEGLVRCRVSGLFADRIDVDGSVDLRGMETTAADEVGSVRLRGAVIGGDLDLDEAKLDRLRADGVRVGGEFRFRGGAVGSGRSVHLVEARVCGGLRLDDVIRSALDDTGLWVAGSSRLSLWGFIRRLFTGG